LSLEQITLILDPKGCSDTYKGALPIVPVCFPLNILASVWSATCPTGETNIGNQRREGFLSFPLSTRKNLHSRCSPWLKLLPWGSWPPIIPPLRSSLLHLLLRLLQDAALQRQCCASSVHGSLLSVWIHWLTPASWALLIITKLWEETRSTPP